MKIVNGNKSVIIGMALRGELKIGDIVFSEVNNCKYKIEASREIDANDDVEFIGVVEII